VPTYVPKDREVGSFPILPPDRYAVQVEKIKPGWGATGTPYLGWQLRVFDGDLAGSSLFLITSMAEAALPYPDTGLWHVLAVLGLDSALEEKDFESFEDFAEEMDSIAAGATCAVDTDIDIYENKERNRVTCVRSLDDYVPDAISPEVARNPAPVAAPVAPSARSAPAAAARRPAPAARPASPPVHRPVPPRGGAPEPPF